MGSKATRLPLRDIVRLVEEAMVVLVLVLVLVSGTVVRFDTGVMIPLVREIVDILVEFLCTEVLMVVGAIRAIALCALLMVSSIVDLWAGVMINVLVGTVI